MKETLNQLHVDEVLKQKQLVELDAKVNSITSGQAVKAPTHTQNAVEVEQTKVARKPKTGSAHKFAAPKSIMKVKALVNPPKKLVKAAKVIRRNVNAGKFHESAAQR